MDFYFNWKRSGTLLRGFDGSDWLDGSLVYPVSFPGSLTNPEEITLSSSARDSHTFETVKDVKLYLAGDAADVQVVQEIWPYYGADPEDPEGVHPKPELDGGFELSFDMGRTYIRFDRTHGFEADPTTWIALPAEAIGQNGQDGVLGPFDMARMIVRYRVPPQADQLRVFKVRLEAAGDVI